MSTPIPLTAFEEFLLWTDRPAYPWTIFVRGHFDGVLDRTAVENALHVALQRHPLLRSVVTRNGRRHYWNPVDGAQIEVHWQQGQTGGPLPPAQYLDLRTEIGLRAWVIQGAASAEMTVQIHHACTDGGGINTFLCDFIMAYAIECGENSCRLRLPELEIDHLERRGRFGLTKWKLLKILPQQMVGLVGAAQFFGRRPVPVLPCTASSNDDAPPVAFPSQVTLMFSRAVARGLREAAKAKGATLNDLLARDLFVAVNEWRNTYHTGDQREWLRMMVPLNMRTTADGSMPAANVVSSVFLDRRGKDCQDVDGLLQGIHHEMQLIKDLRLGLTFIGSLHFSRLLPGGLKRLARRDRCSVSLVFTNLGSILRRTPLRKVDGFVRGGGVVLRQLDTVVPVGPYNSAVFSIHYYGQRLTVTLHYDSRVISEPQANQLMEILGQRLRSSARLAGPENEGVEQDDCPTLQVKPLAGSS